MSKLRRYRSHAALSDSELESAKETAGCQERVQLIAELMTQVRWGSAVRAQLMVVWGVPKGTVNRMASEASELLREAYRDTEEVVPRIAAALDGMSRVALDKERALITPQGEVVSVPDPDVRAAVAAQRELAQILNLTPREAQVQINIQNLNDEKLVASVVRRVCQVPHLRALLVESLRQQAPEILLEANNVIDTEGTG